jgi:hypothetical protein
MIVVPVAEGSTRRLERRLAFGKCLFETWPGTDYLAWFLDFTLSAKSPYNALKQTCLSNKQQRFHSLSPTKPLYTSPYLKWNSYLHPFLTGNCLGIQRTMKHNIQISKCLVTYNHCAHRPTTFFLWSWELFRSKPNTLGPTLIGLYHVYVSDKPVMSLIQNALRLVSSAAIFLSRVTNKGDIFSRPRIFTWNWNWRIMGRWVQRW